MVLKPRQPDAVLRAGAGGTGPARQRGIPTGVFSNVVTGSARRYWRRRGDQQPAGTQTVVYRLDGDGHQLIMEQCAKALKVSLGWAACAVYRL